MEMLDLEHDVDKKKVEVGRCQGAEHAVLRRGARIEACPICLDAIDHEEEKVKNVVKGVRCRSGTPSI
jgi:hypothetical protein